MWLAGIEQLLQDYASDVDTALQSPHLAHTLQYPVLGTSFVSKGHAFALLNGITAKEPQCLVVEGGRFGVEAGLSIEPCKLAARRGDGREIFSFGEDGQLHSLPGDECVVMADTPPQGQNADGTEAEVEEGQHLGLGSCDKHGPESLSWRPLAQGLLQATSSPSGDGEKQLCLGVMGPGPPASGSRFGAPRKLWPVVGPCEGAESVAKARGKWFLSGVREFRPCERLLRDEQVKDQMSNSTALR
eukprot:gnl/TRDRNA2_/TRDRNA2_187831_c0_seq1.p1 gnl/TRDRNA2_/TRDRNA2_187831_c0~~gnl/TRDRNA2_/TRDRNA2_187831_c0_seq1.p1  ORF type:complete len:259 (+),score=44.06 gnl/TRDRNA2_/TRDRNA2_187831_c0_seq1:46-777(+)